MTDSAGDSSSDSVLQLVAKKLRSQFLLFSLGIAVVIVTLMQTGSEAVAYSVGAVLVVFLVGALVYSLVERGKGETKSVLDEVEDSRGDGLAVEVWVKHAHANRSENEFHLGDQVRVCVRATRDCYLTLLNLASDGELTILFPNRHNQNNRIQGGATYEVPSDGYGFNIALEEPAGVDRVKAIVTLDPKPLLKTQFSSTGEFFHSVERTATPRAMRVVAAEVKSRDSAEWASASVAFEVKAI